MMNPKSFKVERKDLFGEIYQNIKKSNKSNE